MADTKISALTASTTPLAGTEVLPIVQGGVTKQVSVANLTAGRALSATQLTLTTGNLVVASGQGIDFSATPGTGTSELLADYEEGTWTPELTGPASQTYTSTGYYVKVGSTVLIQGIITWTVAPSGGSNYRVALPFGSTTNKPDNVNFVMVGLNTAAAAIKYFDVYQNSSNAYFRDTSGTAYNYDGLIGTGSLAFSGVYSTT